VIDPGSKISTNKHPVLADKQPETILFPSENLLDDGIGIKLLRKL
jgi:hypothetical protein